MCCHTIGYRGYKLTPSPISSLLTLIYVVNTTETFKKKCQQTLLTAVLTLSRKACRVAGPFTAAQRSPAAPSGQGAATSKIRKWAQKYPRRRKARA
jgi:hypothetical protein